MFSPNLGQFISRDPLGFDAGDVNVRRYEGNGPVDTLDPSGLRPPLWKYPDNWFVDPKNEPKQLFEFDGDDAKIALTIDSDTPLHKVFEQGCMGLNTIRLNLQDTKLTTLPQFSTHSVGNPEVKGYLHLEDALGAQQRLVRTRSRDVRLVLWAYQPAVKPEVVKEFVLKENDRRIDMNRIMKLHVMTDPTYARCFDFATAFQRQDGSIIFWEDMPYGATNNPNLKVIHKKALDPKMATIFFVSAIRTHLREPSSPQGVLSEREAIEYLLPP
jgi:hypothetical protein